MLGWVDSCNKEEEFGKKLKQRIQNLVKHLRWDFLQK